MKKHKIYNNHFPWQRSDAYLGLLRCAKGNETEFDAPAFALSFSDTSSNSTKLIATGHESGELFIHELYHFAIPVFTERLHPNSIFDVKFIPGRYSLLCGSADGTITFFHLPGTRVLHVFREHMGFEVKTIAVRPDNDPYTFASGARDGQILIWDLRSHGAHGHVTNSISNAHLPSNKSVEGTAQPRQSRLSKSSRSITCVLFQNDHTLISGSDYSGDVKVWDLRKTYSNSTRRSIPKHEISYVGTRLKSIGTSNLILDSCQRNLYACLTDGNIYRFNTYSYESKDVAQFSTGTASTSFYTRMSLSHDDQYLICGSARPQPARPNFYLWKTKDPGDPYIEFEGHDKEVTAVSWVPYRMDEIISVSDDCSMKLWTIDRRPFNNSRSVDQQYSGFSFFTEKTPECTELGSSTQSPIKRPVFREISNIITDAVDKSPVSQTDLNHSYVSQLIRSISLSTGRSGLSNSAQCEKCVTYSGNADRIRIGTSSSVVNVSECSQFKSPTANLPNFVLDPKPRAPVARVSCTKSENKPPSSLTSISQWLSPESQSRNRLFLKSAAGVKADSKLFSRTSNFSGRKRKLIDSSMNSSPKMKNHRLATDIRSHFSATFHKQN